MLGWLRNIVARLSESWSLSDLLNRWSTYIGDRDMELAMRNALGRDGFQGHSARFKNVRLVAVQRPGWLQIYTYEASWNTETSEHSLGRTVLGLLRQDERFDRIQIRHFANYEARAQLLHQWADGLVQLRR